VIGTVILFGFLILALSLYQVQVVPQQNGQVEFQHFEEVRNDLVELRAGILQAGSTGQTQYQTIRLGTQYPTRLFGINPPAPAGTIQTSKSYNITIEGSGESVNVSTRFLQYRPGYNELSPSSTWYDASVLYLDARNEGNGIAVIENQNLVSDGGEVQVTALQNDFRQSGTGRVTLELYSAENVTDLPEGPLNITVPTRLSEGEWKNKTDLPTNSSTYVGITDDANGDGVYNLTLNTTDDALTVDTVGIQSPPAGDGESVQTETDENQQNPPVTESVSVRVDDLTDRRSNNPEFYVSYEAQGTFDEIRISAESTQSTASDDLVLTDARGGGRLTPGFGADEEFEISVRAIDGGSVVAERTVITNADTQNPSTNDDLSRSGSAVLTSSDIRDQTNTNSNDPRYRVSYTVSGTGSFSEVQLYALNRQGNGASASAIQTQRSRNNVDLRPGDGANKEYKVAILVLDMDGVVVDDRIVDDTADGTDP
jgi:hypothetical protein